MAIVKLLARSAFSRRRRLPAAWLVIVAVVLVSTAPGRTQPEVTTFAAIGDFGDASVGEGQVAALVKSWNPDFVITLGDNNYEIGAAETIDANIGQFYREFIFPYVGTYGPGGSVNRFFPALGNHDWGDGFVLPSVQSHYDYFELPGNERYYDYVRGPLHMFVLDSDPYEPDGVTSTSAQAAWLQARLAASTSLYKIVYFHHAPYASGVQNAVAWMRWPFREWGATAVLTAHQHHYEALLKENVPFFVNGLGGAGPNQTTFPADGSLIRYRAALGAMRVTASDARITFEFVNTSGALVHTYAIDAPTQPGAPNQLVAGATPTARIDLWWRDNAGDETGYVVTRSSDGGQVFVDLETLPPGSTSYTDTTVEEAPTPYQYRIRLIGGSADGALSNVAHTATVPMPPAAPTLSATALSSSRVQLTWSHAGAATPVRVYRLLQGRFIELGTTDAAATGYEDSGRSAGTTYEYLVRAFNTGGESVSSNIASVTTLPGPSAPANLTATAVSSSQVNLTWTDTSSDEAGFMIQRATDGGAMSTVAWAPANATAFANTGRLPSTTYSYRVRAYHDGGVTSDPSGTATATTMALPAAPGALTATAPSSTQVVLSWTDQSTTEDSFRVFRSTDGVSFAFQFAVAANSTTATNGGLQPSTSYWYRVVAREAGGGESAPSNVALVGTGSPSSLPAAAANLTATAVSSSQINLAWTDASSNETGFRIDRSSDGVTFSTLAWAGAGAVSYANTGRPPNSTSHYRVVAYNAAGNAPPSNVASATTFSALTAPAGLSAVATSATRIQLAWTDTSSGEAGFRVYRSADGGTTFPLLATVGANVTSYANTSATPGTAYVFRVAAYESGGGQSAPSNLASVTTPAVPAAPSNLVATAPSSTQIALTWTDNASGESGFRIDRSLDGVAFSTLAWVGANVTSYVNGGRQPGTTYYYRVAAYDANGSSAPSAVASATTP